MNAKTNTQNTTVANPSANEIVMISKHLGADGMKDLTENSQAEMYFNRESVRKNADKTTVNSVKRLVDNYTKADATNGLLGDAVVRGIVDPENDYEMVHDPKKIKAAEEAKIQLNQRLELMFGFEVQNRIAEAIKASKKTEAKFWETISGMEARKLLGLSKDNTPLAFTLYRSLNAKIDRGLKNAVKKEKMTKEQAAERMVSFKAEKGHFDLTPIITKKLTAAEKKEADKKARQSKMDKITALFVELNGVDQKEVIKTLYSHSEKIAALMSAQVKAGDAIAAKVEPADPNDDLKANARVLKRQIEQIDKGNKKVSDAQKKALNTRFEGMKAKLEKAGIDVATL